MLKNYVPSEIKEIIDFGLSLMTGTTTVLASRVMKEAMFFRWNTKRPAAT